MSIDQQLLLGQWGLRIYTPSYTKMFSVNPYKCILTYSIHTFLII